MNETLISRSTSKVTWRSRPYHFIAMLVVIVALFVLAAGVTSAMAQPGATYGPGPASVPAGPSAPMVGGNQFHPTVAYNSTNGEYLVVWSDGRNGTGNYDIYGQRVSDSGAFLGSEIPISTASGGQYGPTVIYNSASNEYLVVWVDRRNGIENDNIYGQRVSDSGALLGSEIPISTASGGQYTATLAYDSASGEYLVVWTDGRNGLENYDIYGQRVSISGVLVGSEIPISTAPDNQQSPKVAYDSLDNTYLIVWDDRRTGQLNLEIYGQRVSISGVLVGSEIPISTRSESQTGPAVAYDSANNEYLVVWYDYRSGNEYDIYGQRVSSGGVLAGSNFPISIASGSQFRPDVGYNSTNDEYLVIWGDGRNGGSEDIYGQRVSSGGALVGSEIPISTAPNSQENPAVIYNSTNSEYLIAWEDGRNFTDWDIYGQRISGNGSLVGSDFLIAGTPLGATPTPEPPTATPVPSTATPTPCVPGQFSDVPPDHTFYPYVSCLVDRGVMSGYADCTFRPSNNLTRGQLAKVVSNAANFSEPPTDQTFEDVATDHTFYIWIERLASRGIIGGYECGGEGEPCVAPDNRPYFRSGNNVTRGQTAKIVAIGAGLPTPSQGSWTFQDVPSNHTFWQWVEALSAAEAIGGYECGGEGEPCVAPDNRPYFRVGNNVTRGQASKIVASTFFQGCQVSNRR
jgi:hypothetical protein